MLGFSFGRVVACGRLLGGEMGKLRLDGCAWCVVVQGAGCGGSKAVTSVGEDVLLCHVWHVWIEVACML